MIRIFLLMLLGTLAATEARSRPLQADDLAQMRTISDVAVSADGAFLAYTLSSTDLAADRRRKSVQVMRLDDRRSLPWLQVQADTHAPHWAPDHALYFLLRKAGHDQLWRRDGKTGTLRRIGPESLDVDSFAISPDGRHLAFWTALPEACGGNLQCALAGTHEKAGSGQAFDQLFVRHWRTWEDGARAQLFCAEIGRDGRLRPPTWISRGIEGRLSDKPMTDGRQLTFSADSSSVVFTARRAGLDRAWHTDSDLWKTSCTGDGTPENLTTENPAADSHPLLSRDSGHLIWLAASRPGRESDRRRIMLRDLSTGKTREVAAQWDRSPVNISLSAEAGFIPALADDAGERVLFSIRLSDGQPRRLSVPGSVEAYAAASKSTVYVHSRFDSPPELFLRSGDGEARLLSAHNHAGFAQIEFSRSHALSFAASDDVLVQGFVFEPLNRSDNDKVPVVLMIHGGPQGAFRDQFRSRWNPQLYTAQGFAVVAINIRGSTGYGQAFTDAVSRDWGGQPLEDLKMGWKAAMKAFPWLDAGNACAIGGSYGGYMVNWIAGRWPDGFRCLVNHAGIFDLRAMAFSSDEQWFVDAELGVPGHDEPALFDQHNPVTQVAAWKTPMLITHGQQDFRVPIEQGLAAFTALQRRGVDSRFVRYPDEAHLIAGPLNTIEWHGEILDWLKQYLGQTSKQKTD